MIRRVYKVRTPRNIISNNNSKVWWSLSFSSITTLQRLVMQNNLKTIDYFKLANNQQNFITGNLRSYSKPGTRLIHCLGYSPNYLTKVIKLQFLPQSKYQTRTRFVNCLNLSQFNQLTSLTKYKKAINPKESFSCQKNQLYRNFYLQTQTHVTLKKWQIRKRIKLTKLYEQNGQMYSMRERVTRMLISRSLFNQQHPYFVQPTTRIRF